MPWRTILGTASTPDPERVIQDNPVNYDMLDAMEMVKPRSCPFHHQQRGEDLPHGGRGSLPGLAGRTRICHDNQAVSFKARADVTFACAGGYPKDVSLYQAANAMIRRM